MKQMNQVSVIIPAKNEAASIASVVNKLKSVPEVSEIIVVDDGSDDGTGDLAEKSGAIVVTHPYSRGNGAAIKSGVRAADGEILAFMDADGQHRPEDLTRLLAELEKGHDMVVAARDINGQASKRRLLGNVFYNKLASWMVGHKIHDLTSGFRVARAKLFKEVAHLLPNGFSYPTTSTMAFFRSGYSVAYVSVNVLPRDGKSHIRILKDGLRFLLIIFKIGTLYSPLKLFFPFAVANATLGFGYYLYTYLEFHRFTNMSAILLTTAVQIFLIGLVAEQITALMYSRRRRDD
ncbi:MAG: glycosyltransferase family 2 protein [Pseudomonadales bacterium]